MYKIWLEILCTRYIYELRNVYDIKNTNAQILICTIFDYYWKYVLYKYINCSLITRVNTVCGPILQKVGQKPFQRDPIPSFFAIDIITTIMPGGFSMLFMFCILRI